jgi:hypothetical protein
MAAGRLPASGQPDEIFVHFDDTSAASKEVIAAAKKLGIDLGLTPRELDALRARRRDLRRWLAADASRHEAFVRDPQAVMAALDQEAPPRRRRRPAAGSPVRWQGVGRSGETAEAGAAVAAWAVAEPGRLALLLADPVAAINAALIGSSTRARKRLIELAVPTGARRRPAGSPSSKMRSSAKQRAT